MRRDKMLAGRDQEISGKKKSETKAIQAVLERR